MEQQPEPTSSNPQDQPNGQTEEEIMKKVIRDITTGSDADRLKQLEDLVRRMYGSDVIPEDEVKALREQYAEDWDTLSEEAKAELQRLVPEVFGNPSPYTNS